MLSAVDGVTPGVDDAANHEPPALQGNPLQVRVSSLGSTMDQGEVPARYANALAACGALIAREEIGICVGKHQGGCRSPEVVGDVSIAPKEKGVAHSGVAKKCF